MSSILDEIFHAKRKEVERMRSEIPINEMIRAARMYSRPALDLATQLRRHKQSTGFPGLIAEIKRASPSKGVFAPELDSVVQAELYRVNGAAAISILTDKSYFHGSIDDLREVSEYLEISGPRLPLLRKDFIYDPYQIFEARASGADAILLILAWLSDESAGELFSTARDLGMTALFETHNRTEIERAIQIGAKMIGINNRNLHDFSVRLDTTRELSRLIPSEVVIISESGIHTSNDVLELSAYGVDGVLVGESIVIAPDVGLQVRMLSGVGQFKKMDQKAQ